MKNISEELANELISESIKAADKMDEELQKHVILRLPAEPGWKYGMSNMEGTKVTIHPVTQWGLIGPMEFPLPLPNWNMSVLPLDEQGKPVSLKGFQGVFGPDFGDDERILEHINRAMAERMKEAESNMQKMFEGMGKVKSQIEELAKNFPKA